MYQKRLTIEIQMDWDTAFAVTKLLQDCPDGPTFQVQRSKIDGEAAVFFSKRTYDYLQTQLRVLRTRKEI